MRAVAKDYVALDFFVTFFIKEKSKGGKFGNPKSSRAIKNVQWTFCDGNGSKIEKLKKIPTYGGKEKMIPIAIGIELLVLFFQEKRTDAIAKPALFY